MANTEKKQTALDAAQAALDAAYAISDRSARIPAVQAARAARNKAEREAK